MDFFRKLFRRKRKPDSSDPSVGPLPAPHSPQEAGFPPSDPRVRQAVESVLDNEALTQELEDSAAGALISWGVAWAETLARTVSRSVETRSDEAMGIRLRAVRRMMRLVSKWAVSQADMDQAERLEAVKAILGQASQVLGINLLEGDAQLEEWSNQLGKFSAQPELAVNEFRRLIEKNTSFPV